MDPVQFARALLHVQYDFDRFRLSLERMEAHDFPSDSANDRIGFLKDELGETKTRIAEIEADYADDPSGAADRLVSECRKLSQNRQQLEILDRARSDEVPWSLVPSIEKLAKEILPDHKLLLTSVPQMNYMVRWAPSGSNRHITVFLPALHRGNAFLHILIGHELFHPLVEGYVLSEQAKVDTFIRDECKKILPASPQPLFDDRLDRIAAFAINAWRQGLKEFMCDMGACTLFGPAGYWSLSSFAATRELDVEPSESSQFYPSWRLRLKTAFEYLMKHEGLASELSRLAKLLKDADLGNFADSLDKTFEKDQQFTENSVINFTNPIVKIAYEAIDQALPDAMDKVKSLGGSMSANWSSALEDVPALIKRIELLVPPCELIEPGKQKSRPATFSGILLTGWVARIEAENAGLDLGRYRELCRLTLKAIEDADLKKDFMEWRSS